jgi:hypothetical protein
LLFRTIALHARCWLAVGSRDWFRDWAFIRFTITSISARTAIPNKVEAASTPSIPTRPAHAWFGHTFFAAS